MGLRRDVTFGLRMLRKNPLLLIVASCSLGLGIGLNTTVFSAIHATLLRGPDIERADDLVNFYSAKEGTADLNPNSYADFLDMRERLEGVDSLVGYSLAMMNYDGGGLPSVEIGSIVTDGYFDLLESFPEVGRLFRTEDFESEAPVAIVSHRFWQNELGGEPGAVGSTVRLGGRVFEVIGVLTEDFTGFFRGLIPDIVVPITVSADIQTIGEVSAQGSPGGRSVLEWRGYRFLTVIGRLARGSTLERTQAEANALASALADEFPDTNLARSATLLESRKVRVDPEFDGYLVPAAILLLGLVALVLLVACANVANLLLVRAQSRSAEIAVRTSLGASRWQIVRLLLVECTLLGLIAGAIGLFVTWLGLRLLRFVDLDLPIDPQLALRFDEPVLLFTLGISLATSLLFGMIPARRAARLTHVTSLRSDRAMAAIPRRRFLPANILVVAQVAMCLVLVVTAGLLLRSVDVARSIDPGFDVGRLGNVTVELNDARLSAEDLPAIWQRMEERIEALPGIETVALNSRLPLGLSVNTSQIYIPGIRETEADPPISLDVTRVDEDYFTALDLRLVNGRLLDPRDDLGTLPVAVVTEEMVRRFWPGESALGRRFRVGSSDGVEVEIVGVVRDYKIRTPDEPPRPMVHFAWRQRPQTYGVLAFRSTGPPENQLPRVVAAARSEVPGLLVIESTTMTRMRDLLLLPLRAGSALAAGLASLALLLAVLGLSGAIIYWVSWRAREIGMRMALGATRGSVLRLVLSRVLFLIGVGLILGAAAAVALGRSLAAVLYVPPLDPVSFSMGVAILLAAGIVAAVVPARRAISIDPMTVLRQE
jgi:macrolide transport system ATP-binding/permease protein